MTVLSLEIGNWKSEIGNRKLEIGNRQCLFKAWPQKIGRSMGVERPVLAKSSGEEGKPLHRRRSRRISRGRLLLRRSRCLARVGHQTYIHTAVVSRTLPILMPPDRLIFTPPNRISLVGGNCVLRRQEL